MNTKIKMIPCIVVFALAVFFVGDVFGSDPGVGIKAPGFTLASFEGKDVSLSDFKGRIVVLEWFNDECPFVRAHYDKATTMIDLSKKYKAKNVVWLAINSTNNATETKYKQFIKNHVLPYPILDDRSGVVGRAYGAKTTPHIFIVDGEGTIVYDGGIDDSPMGRKGAKGINYVDAALASLTGGESVVNPKTKPYGCNVKYKKAPGFNLKAFDGKGVKLSDFKGKVVVLEWFNDECPFVKYHYEKKATMLDLAKKYKEQKVVWLAINSTSHATDRQTIDFFQKHNFVHPVLDDRSGKVGRAYGAKTTPHIFIVDTKGNVVYNGGIDNSPMGKNAEGEVRVNYVDKALSEVLAGKTVSTPATKPYGCNVKYPKKLKPQR